MAKPVKVVVHEKYYDMLVAKAELLDRMFGDEGEVRVQPSDFKDYLKLDKALDKMPVEMTNVEPHEAPTASA